MKTDYIDAPQSYLLILFSMLLGGSFLCVMNMVSSLLMWFVGLRKHEY